MVTETIIPAGKIITFLNKFGGGTEIFKTLCDFNITEQKMLFFKETNYRYLGVFQVDPFISWLILKNVIEKIEHINVDVFDKKQ